MTVQIFFLDEPDGHYTILLEPAIQLASIDTKRGCGAHLVPAELLQHGKNVTLLDLRKGHRVVDVSLKHLPEVVCTRLRMRSQNLRR